MLHQPAVQSIVTSEIRAAEKKLGHVYQALEKGKPDRAIKSLKKASEHAQLAIAFFASWSSFVTPI